MKVAQSTLNKMLIKSQSEKQLKAQISLNSIRRSTLKKILMKPAGWVSQVSRLPYKANSNKKIVNNMKNTNKVESNE